MTDTVVSSRDAFRGKMVDLRVDQVRLVNGRAATGDVVEHFPSTTRDEDPAPAARGELEDATTLVGALLLRARRG